MVPKVGAGKWPRQNAQNAKGLAVVLKPGGQNRINAKGKDAKGKGSAFIPRQDGVLIRPGLPGRCGENIKQKVGKGTKVFLRSL